MARVIPAINIRYYWASRVMLSAVILVLCFSRGNELGYVSLSRCKCHAANFIQFNITALSLTWGVGSDSPTSSCTLDVVLRLVGTNPSARDEEDIPVVTGVALQDVPFSLAALLIWSHLQVTHRGAAWACLGQS